MFPLAYASVPAFKPKGGHEALERALDLLGPFEFESEAEANAARDKEAERRGNAFRVQFERIASLPESQRIQNSASLNKDLNSTLFGDDRQFWSREVARKYLEGLAGLYNLWCDAAKRSPTLGKLNKQLVRVEEAAKRLADAIVALGHSARDLLHTGGSLQQNHVLFEHSQLGDIYRQARGGALPMGYLAPPLGSVPTKWTLRLCKLEELCRLVRYQFLVEAGFRGGILPSKSSNRKTFRAQLGHPKWLLANFAYYLFDQRRPGDATGDTSNVYYDFASAIYEYATGQEGDAKGVGLETYTTDVCALRRELVQLDELISKFSARAQGKRVSNSGKRTRAANQSNLRLNALIKARDEVLAAVCLHGRRPKIPPVILKLMKRP